jgi:hypothetical protein
MSAVAELDELVGGAATVLNFFSFLGVKNVYNLRKTIFINNYIKFKEN